MNNISVEESECIICFEKETMSVPTYSSLSPHIKSISDFDCLCKYQVHRHCYRKWITYNHPPYCIICRKQLNISIYRETNTANTVNNPNNPNNSIVTISRTSTYICLVISVIILMFFIILCGVVINQIYNE